MASSVESGAADGARLRLLALPALLCGAALAAHVAVRPETAAGEVVGWALIGNVLGSLAAGVLAMLSGFAVGFVGWQLGSARLERISERLIRYGVYVGYWGFASLFGMVGYGAPALGLALIASFALPSASAVVRRFFGTASVVR